MCAREAFAGRTRVGRGAACENAAASGLSAADTFATSSEPVERLYTPLDIADMDYERDLRSGRIPLHARSATDHVSRAACGRCASTRALERREIEPEVPLPVEPGPDGISVAFDLPANWATTPTTRWRSPRWGRLAWRSIRSTTWRPCSPASRWTRSPRSITINAPASVMLAMYIAAAEKAGRAARKSSTVPFRTMC